MAVLNFILQFMKRRQYPPTRAEIATGMGFASPNAAQCHLEAMERSGVLTLDRGFARGIKVGPR
jgi:repressor LexA